MGAIQSFATSSLPQSQRLRYWNELAERIYAGTYVNADGNFHGRMLTWNLDELQMIRPSGGRSLVGRREGRLDKDNIILHRMSRGRCLHRQGNASCELEAGDFVLASAGRGYEIDLDEHELMVIEFPRAPLMERFGDLDTMLTRRIRGANLASGRIFSDFLHSIWRQADDFIPGSEPWSHGITDAFYDLLVMVLNEESRSNEGGAGSQSLRRQLVAFIEANLEDPDLRSQSMADAVSASIRTVQNCFAAMGTTPSAYVLDLRLQRAADRMTADPRATITAIAFDLGFNDSAYFSRCFRQKFGKSPREWRAGI